MFSAWNAREPARSDGVDILLGEHGDLAVGTQSIGRCFLDGLVANLLNIKIALFYMAAVPQWIAGDEASGSAFVLVIIHVLINALWFIAVAFVLDYLVCRSVNGRFVEGLRRVSGYALIILSLVFVANAMQLI